ncbi:MAG: hypothetical protein K0S65_1050 [Labilithrix sp.]|nr:hypothetical protein [Labilithrix sp.]
MKTISILNSGSLVALVTLAALACGGSSKDAKPTTPLTVWLFDESLSIADEARPLARVDVALDPPGGGDRVIRQTEADGHVTFDADFSAGAARVSGFSPEHTLVTMLDVSPDSIAQRPNTYGKPPHDLVLVLPRLDSAIRSTSVEVHGALTGKRDPAHVVSIAASGLGRLGTSITAGPTYTLRAPRGRAFFLLGHETGPLREEATTVTIEHFESFRVDSAPLEADGTLDIDLGSVTPLPTKTVRLRAATPAGSGAFGTGTRAVAEILSADSQLVTGAFTRSSAAAEGTSFDLDMTVVDTDIAPERLMTQASLFAPDGSISRRSELGAVSDGTAWTDFLAPPVVPDASRTLADAIPLDRFPSGADLRIEVFANEQLIWVLHGAPGGPRESTFVLPSPFGITFSADVQLFAVSIAAEVDRVELPPHGAFYRRVAIGRDVILRRR